MNHRKDLTRRRFLGVSGGVVGALAMCSVIKPDVNIKSRPAVNKTKARRIVRNKQGFITGIA